MSLPGIRLIIDTNALLRGVAKGESTSGRLVRAVERRELLLLTSAQIIEEYRLILLDPELLDRYPPLTPTLVEAKIRSLIYLSENHGRIRTRFQFPRDPKDAKFLALAIAGRASHIVTFDKDLLSLNTAHTDAATRLRQRLPRLRIQMPGDFIAEIQGRLEI